MGTDKAYPVENQFPPTSLQPSAMENQPGCAISMTHAELEALLERTRHEAVRQGVREGVLDGIRQATQFTTFDDFIRICHLHLQCPLRVEMKSDEPAPDHARQASTASKEVLPDQLAGLERFPSTAGADLQRCVLALLSIRPLTNPLLHARTDTGGQW